MFEAHDKMNQSMDDAVNKYRAERSAIESVSKEEKARLAELAKMKAIQLAAEQRQAAAEAKRTAVLARLKKMQQVPGKGKAKVGGVVPTSTLESAEQEAINFRAAELLLIKQKDNSEELKRLKALRDRIEYQKLVNDLSERYVDILRVLGDQKITDDEIKALAAGWKMPVEAVKAYLIQFQAVSDGKISADEITNLAKTWGSTEEQAKKYLEFYNYINDGFLSDDEIKKLMKSWTMTEEEVRKYADFVQVVNDGKLDDSEVVKLQDKWKLSIDEVVAYIKKIGSPVSYSGTLIDPAKAAEIAWLNAAAALQKYLDLLGKGTTTITPPTTTTPPVITIPPKNDGLGGSKTDSAATAASSAASAASAIAYAVAKATGDSTKAALAAAGVTPSALASQESGAIGAASIAAQLKAAEDQVRIASSLAAFKAKEAADAAASANNSISDAAYDAAERARFRAMSGVMAGTGTPSNSGGAVNVTVNVAGSVTAEQDLVTTIRNGLLTAQYNGNSITLEAI
jgi:Ca2+-binding EF-hand superfamily protein